MLVLDLGNLKINSEKNKVGGEEDKVIEILYNKYVCFVVKYFKREPKVLVFAILYVKQLFIGVIEC